MENDENPDVTTSNSAFADALAAQHLRQKITYQADGAVRYGHVDRDWANNWLARLGAEPVTGKAEYRINQAVTGVFGKTVYASSRAAALEHFNQEVARIAQAGQITDGYCDNVYAVQFPDGELPTFYSGPEDPQPVAEQITELGALKVAIRQMLKEGVTDQGWGIGYASSALAEMGLPELPSLHYKQVNVPVNGVAAMSVAVFEGDDDAAVQRSVSAAMARTKQVLVKPDEVGPVFMSRPDGAGGMSMVLVDDEDDEDDGDKY